MSDAEALALAVIGASAMLSICVIFVAATRRRP
jgi:hypothetical protein